MAPFGPWADLHTELLCSIADGLSLKHYTSIGGACPAWRSALAPPFPSLLVIADGRLASALPFLMQGSFHVSTLKKCSFFLGSSNDCFAVASEWLGIFLLNPLTGEEIKLLRMNNCGKVVPKVVFAPNPRPDNYTVVALCDGNKIGYTKTRDMKWFICDIAMNIDQLTDLAYDIDGCKVYCLTECGDVHVLHIPHGRWRKPIVEPLLAAERAVGVPFDPAVVFASPYHTASKLTRSKQIFLCNGSLYQVWRNTAGAIAWRLPAGGRFSMSEDEIFVLRYNPGRQPCWDVVQDLGGYSVFIARTTRRWCEPKASRGSRPVVFTGSTSGGETCLWCLTWSPEPLHPLFFLRTMFKLPDAEQAAGISSVTTLQAPTDGNII
ncbi:hypothetical protein ACQ4PT_024801 [Festuca glaucescens]